jgi:spore maturation protein CgeB
VDAGFHVDVFGGGWEYLKCGHPENLTVHGPLDSAGCLREISNSRISLNVMPWFKDGAHDRVFNSMLNGAVSVTDDSKYMREIFTDGEDVVFYDLEDMDGLVEKVRYLLEHGEKAEEIAKKGRERARKGHTWKDRGEALDWYIREY